MATFREYLKEANVTNKTRAGKNGKEIICPKCKKSSKVYNFTWDEIVCLNCGKDVKKKDWIIK